MKYLRSHGHGEICRKEKKPHRGNTTTRFNDAVLFFFFNIATLYRTPIADCGSREVSCRFGKYFTSSQTQRRGGKARDNSGLLGNTAPRVNRTLGEYYNILRVCNFLFLQEGEVVRVTTPFVRPLVRFAILTESLGGRQRTTTAEHS